jgi:hypothetical protein
MRLRAKYLRWLARAALVLCGASVMYVGCCYFLYTKSERNYHVNGRTLDQVIEELGMPDRADAFFVSEISGELRCEILNTYPRNDPGNDSVRIREYWWTNPYFTTVVWFHRVGGEWLVLDACRFGKWVAF